MINLDTYINNFDLPFEDDLNDKETSENEESISEEISSEDSKSEETLVENTKSEEVLAEDAQSEEVSEDTIPKEVPEKTSNENASNDKENLNPKFLFSNLIGKKIGMTQLFTDSGDVFPATVVEAGPCTVTQIKNKKSDGYDSIQLGFSDAKEKHLTKSKLGHFLKSKLSPKKVLKEFRFDKNDNLPSIGDEVDLRQFKVGDFVTVTGFSIGKVRPITPLLT